MADSRVIEVVRVGIGDFRMVSWMFEQAMQRGQQAGYKVWTSIDTGRLQKDIQDGRMYKVMHGERVGCIFSVQMSDPFIWGDRDRSDAIYLHRIVVHPEFKGQRELDHVLAWATSYARAHGRIFLRMDTWADNQRILKYYQSFGFEVVGHHKTDDNPELPEQNRDIDVVLLEVRIHHQ